MEKVGVQIQTSCKDPRNLRARRVCVGPDLYFKAEEIKILTPFTTGGMGP